MNKKPQLCNAWLPPDHSEKCLKQVDPLCQNQCFEHCYGKLYPETSPLRCENPQHPPYQKPAWQKHWESTQEKAKKELQTKQWKYPYASEEIPASKTKLRNAIKKDLKLLKSFLPIDESWLPDEYNDELWDNDDCNELAEELEKIKLVINHPKGLQTKLSLWEDLRDDEETEAEEVDCD